MLTEDDKRHQWDGAALAGGALEVALLVAVASQLKKNGENGDYLAGGVALASVLPSIIAKNKKPILQATQRDVEGSFLLNAYSDIDNAVPTAMRRQVTEWAKTEAGRLAKETLDDVKKPMEDILRNMEESARQGYYETARAAKRYAPRIGYEKALEKSVTELARSGITSLSYVTKNGTTVRYPVDVGIRETLTRAGKDRLDAQQDDMAKRLGINYCDVSICPDARESHARWQGKRYQIEGSGKYPNFNEACLVGDLVDGYGGYNCHHTRKLVRDPDAKFSFKDPLEGTGYTNKQVRELTTRQRQIENKLRKEKRVAETLEAVGLPTQGSNRLIRSYQAQLRAMVDEHPRVLHRMPWRESIYQKARKSESILSAVHLSKDATKRINTKLIDRAMSAAAQSELSVTKTLISATETAGTSLKGLEFKLKSRSSFERKINSDLQLSFSNPVKYDKIIKEIHDNLRYTAILNPSEFGSQFQQIKTSLEAKGHSFVRVKNSMAKMDGSYRGVNTLVSDESGYIYELQFHTEKSFEAKMKAHEFYEIERVSKEGSKEWKNAKKRQIEIFTSFKTPSGAEEIAAFDRLKK